MTVNFFEDDESDGSFARKFLEDKFLDDAFFEDDEIDDGLGFMDFSDPDDDLTIDFAFDTTSKELACIYTGGLWHLGIPELYIRLPRDLMSGHAMADARVAVFLASGIVHLGMALLETDGFDVPPYQSELDGRQVTFWLGDHQPPFELLTVALDSDVDTVIEVHCSLFHAPLFGDGFVL